MQHISPQQPFPPRPASQVSQPAKPASTTQDSAKQKQSNKPQSPKSEKPIQSSHTAQKPEPVVTKEELFAKFKTEGNDLVKKVRITSVF